MPESFLQTRGRSPISREQGWPATCGWSSGALPWLPLDKRVNEQSYRNPRSGTKVVVSAPIRLQPPLVVTEVASKCPAALFGLYTDLCRPVGDLRSHGRTWRLLLALLPLT